MTIMMPRLRLPFGPALAAVLLCIAQSSGAATTKPYSYQNDVRPVLEKNCIICHACYDAPCQLKMESPEGIARGASKARVYLPSRFRQQNTTRLGLDATSTASWRSKGFYSVTEGAANSLLARMLELGHKNAPKENVPYLANINTGVWRDFQCATPNEFQNYSHRHMHEGMPLGMAPLAPADYETLQGWLAQGAPLDAPASSGDSGMISAWEEFLNRRGNRNQLVARYIYEHLFLAHLYFDANATSGFYEIVRSSTPPGAPIQPMPTRRPTDDPGDGVYYRVRPINGAILTKNHVTYPAGSAKLSHLQALFSSEDFKVDALPPYQRNSSTNPLTVFSAIPPRIRFQFLLDDAFFFVQSFIRGPVCLGQVATDVIDDHFFIMFQKPGSDPYVTEPEYAKKQTPYLRLANESTFTFDYLPEWLRSEQTYSANRVKRYQGRGGARFDDLWDGDGSNPDALLTVFRNFDNSAVIRGLRGRTPKTAWVMDYPIFERIYYCLVANFDVFGSNAHQIQTRLYFDLLRAESEANFLRFFPAAARKSTYASWYKGSIAAAKRNFVYSTLLDTKSESQLGLSTQDPKADLLAQVVSKMQGVLGATDPLTGDSVPKQDRSRGLSDAAKVESALAGLIAPTGAAFIKNLPETTFLRIEVDGKEGDLAYTLLRNCAHHNVAFMFREEARLDPANDYLSLLRGPVSCYPNFIFSVPLDKIDDFAAKMAAANSSADFTALVQTYGVRRTHPAIFGAFKFFRDYQQRMNPVEAGIYDANRYANF